MLRSDQSDTCNMWTFRSLRWLLIAALFGLITGACLTDEDCRLNGICNLAESPCQCDSGWTSKTCGVLDLQPVKCPSGYNVTNQGSSSWGSKIIRDPHDPSRYHLFVAEFLYGCGLDYWSPYSTIARAESCSGADGPYHFASEVAGAFSHNPTVVWSPADQQWLMYYIGCPQALDFNGTCLAPSFSYGSGNNVNGESGISVQSSRNLRDRKFEGQVMTGQNSLVTCDADITNPSPLPLFTASTRTPQMLLAYRDCPYNCTVGLEQINLATAMSGFQGPYQKLQVNPIFPESNEDPLLWRDKRGNFHMLLHSLEPTGGFGHGP